MKMWINKTLYLQNLIECSISHDEMTDDNIVTGKAFVVLVKSVQPSFTI